MTSLTTKARRLVEQATPGPWQHHGASVSGNTAGLDHVAECRAHRDVYDAKFIAAAPSLVRELCEEVERLEMERAEAIRYMSTDQIEYGKLVADLCKQRDTALRERDEARAECERMRPVYEAAVQWHAQDDSDDHDEMREAAERFWAAIDHALLNARKATADE
jgi:hypothetical protein